MVLINRLIWDSQNITHIAKHDVIPDEVEEACQRDHVILMAKHGRFFLIGTTEAGRPLTTVLDKVSVGVYYPVTARTTSRKDRRYYKEIKGEL